MVLSGCRSFRPLFVGVGLLLLSACGTAPEPAQTPVSLRLIDAFETDWIQGSPAAGSQTPPLEWRFDGETPSDADATLGWQGSDVRSLSLRQGRLTGIATSDFPVLHFERTSGLDDPDLLHEVEIGLRATAGSSISMTVIAETQVDFGFVRALAAEIPWPMRAELTPGDELQTYTLKPFIATPANTIRHLLIRPTDEAGAEFEIEFVRLTLRRQHLAKSESGIGWHGLNEQYRESVLCRSPETFSWPVTLPANAAVDLAVGTLQEQPVTFHLDIDTGDGDWQPLLQRTVTTPHRWEPLRLAIDAPTGQQAVLRLHLQSASDGALGLWGSPAIRSTIQASRTESSQTAESHQTAEGPLTAEGPPTRVIFVLGDTLRRDHLEPFGYHRATTPHLSRMASQGAILADTVAQGSWTKVSAPSMFTGLYATSHGVAEVIDRLPSSAETLAEAYRAAGYATYGLSALPFTGKFSNLHQGYEELHEKAFDPRHSKNGREYVDRFLDWLERHDDVPFFAFLHLFDPHSPYEPAQPWSNRWADPAWHAEHRAEGAALRQATDDVIVRISGMAPRQTFDDAGLDAERYQSREKDWYDGAIAGMDAEIGRLFERLSELGLDRDTLVVFASDHGEEFLEHGRMFHGQSVYGELINVPAILWAPGHIEANRRIDQTVQLIDLMPTMLEISQLPVPNAVQGRSLLSDLAIGSAGTGLRPLPAISENAPCKLPGAPAPKELGSTAIIDGDWKLIHHFERPLGGPEFELFDHAADPLDLVDLATENPQVVERLLGLLQAWRGAAEAARLPADPGADSNGDSSAEDAAALERLRALGYVQ